MIFALILLALLQQTPETAAPDERPVPVIEAPRPDVDGLLIEEVRRIADRVELIRSEEFVRPPFAVRIPEAMRQVAAEIRATTVLPRARLAARGRAWSDIGLGDEETPRKLTLFVAGDLDGIGFDPKGNRLLVTPGLLRPEDFGPTGEDGDPATVLMLTGMRPDEPLVAHLLTHVRQLERTGEDALESTTDALLASATWAEGEANLVAVGYAFAGVSVGGEVTRFIRSPGEVLGGSLLPSGLDALEGVERALAEFIYLDGFDRAADLHRRGGWKGLDEAMRTRRTTRDLMNPGQAPSVPVEFAEPDSPGVGFELVDTDSVGQQGAQVLISFWTGKDSLALQAADGWLGDRLHRWESGEDVASGITEWVTRWGSAQAAKDFDYAYTRAMAARHPSSEPADAGDGTRSLIAGDRLVRLERSGNEFRVEIRPLGSQARDGTR